MKRILLILAFFIGFHSYSQADIQVTYSDFTDYYEPGGTNTYVLTVRNTGPSVATNITITGGIPAGIDEYSWTGPNGTFDADDALNQTIATLASGGTVTYLITMKASVSFLGNIISTVSASSAVSDPNPSNNTATDTDSRYVGADLVVTNTNGQSFYTPGTTVNYTVTILNAGPYTTTNVQVVYPIPANVQNFTWTGPNGSGGSNSGINTVVPGQLNEGASYVFNVSFTIPPDFTGPLVTQASASSYYVDPVPTCSGCIDTDLRGTNLTYSVTDNKTNFTPGDTNTYVVTVSNQGDFQADNVVVSLPLPLGVTSMTWTGTDGSSGSGALSATLATLAPGATVTYTLTAITANDFYANIIAQLNVTSTTPDTTPGCTSCTDTDSVIISSQANIAVTNTDNQNAYFPGQPLTYTVTVTNNGPNPATDVRVINAVPAGITSFNWTGSNGTSGTGTLNDLIASLAVNQSVTYTITVQVPAGFTGSLSSTATANAHEFDPAPANNKATDTDAQVTVGADIIVTNTNGQTTYTPGQTGVTYTITVTNKGPQNASNVLVTNPIPAGVTNFSWSGNSQNGTNTALSSIIVTLNAGTSVTFTVTFDVPLAFTGNLTSTANVSSPTGDPNPANNQNIADTDTQAGAGTTADVALTIADNQTTYTAPGTRVYTVTVSNAGPIAATGVQVNVPIPAGITSFSWTGNSQSGTNTALSNTIATLAPGASVIYTVTVQVPSGFTGDLVVAGTITPVTTDSNTANNAAADKDVPDGGADIVVVNSDNTANFIAGQTRTYTVTVTNYGPQTATNVSVQGNVPVGISPSQVSWSGPTASGSGALTTTIPSLGVGETVTYTVAVAVPSNYTGATLIHDISVLADQPDPNPGCAQCSDSDTATPFADLQTVKTDNQSQYLFNSTVVYTITLYNAGPSDATNVVMTDLVPAGITNAANMTWISSTGVTGTGNMTLTIPTLAVGASVFVKVSVQIPLNWSTQTPSPNLTNTVTVTSSTPDPNPGCTTCTDIDTPRSKFVTVDTTRPTYDLVRDVLIASPCANFSNVVTSTNTLASNIGWGYFNRNNSDFPLKDGVVIRSGQAVQAAGPINGTVSTTATGQGDPDVDWIIGDMGLSGVSADHSYIQFKFIPYTNEFSFNFVFASNEYGFWQCQYFDVFGFVLTNLNTGEKKNLAVVPVAGNPPISVNTIRDAAYNVAPSNCASANPQFFGEYYEADQPNADINFRGRTVKMTAFSEVTPGDPYTIKLVVSDYNDQAFDIGVFIEGGSFNIGNPDFRFTDPITGIEDSLTAGGATICGGSGLQFTLKAGTAPIPGATYAWTRVVDGVVENLPDTTYDIQYAEPGEYYVTITFGTSSCSQTYRAEIKDFTDPTIPPTNAPNDILLCQAAAPYIFNIDQDTLIANGATPGTYDIHYYVGQTDAQFAAPNYITNITTYEPPTLPYTIWASAYNNVTGCIDVYPVVLDAEIPGGTFSYPGGPFNFYNTTTITPTLAGLTPGGTFSASPATLDIDPVTGVITPATSTYEPSYTITYEIVASPTACPYVTTTTIEFDLTCATTATSSAPAVCVGGSVDLFASGTEPDTTYAWTGPSFTSAVQNPTGVALPLTPGDYTYTVVKTRNGLDCATASVTVSVYEIPTAAFAVSTFPACLGDTPSVSVMGTPNAVVTVYEQGTTTPISVTLDATGVGSFTTLAVPSTGMVYELTRAESTTTPVCATDYTPGTVTVTITTTPPTATVAAPPTAVCSGDTATFTVTGTPNGVVNYTLGAAGGSVTLDGAGTAPVTTGPITAGVTITLNSIVSGSCTTPLSATASASVLPLPTASFTATTTICAQQAAVIDFTGTPNAQVTFTDSNGTSNTITLTAGGTYQYTSPYPMTANGTFTLNSVVSATTPACTQTLNQQLNFTVNALPAVTQDPAPATQAACEGSTVTFTAAGTGAGVGYQWYGPSGLITGANNATLTLTNITLAQEGNYYVEVSGTCAPSPLSANAFLDVTDAPAITSLAANTVLCEGSNYSITVNATGDNLSYEWRNAANLVVGNTATLTIASITPANAGTYTVTVSGAAGCTPVSQSTTLTINALPQITTQPVGATICEDEGYTFTVAATESLLNFNWYHGSPAALVKSGPDNFLTVAGTMADEGTYYVEVTNPCLPSPGVTSTTVTLNIEQKPRITVQPLSPAPMCTGENFTLSVTATGENLGYQWYGPDGNPIAGATSTSYSVTGAQVNQSGNYFVRVSNTLGECSPVDSTPATITVNQGPAWTVEPGDLNLCVGEAILLSSQASGDALTYSWYKDGVDLNVHTPDLTIAAADVDVTDAGIYRVEVTSPTCPLIFSEAIVLVYPAPQATIANGNEPEICEGQSADVVFSGTPNAVVTYTINGGAPQTIVLSPGGQAILATGQLDATTEYTLVSVITGSEPYCSAPLAGLPNTTAIVKVDRIPDVDLPQDTYLCFDAAGNLLGVHDAFETGLDPAIYSFQWYFEGNPIAGATGSGYTPDSAGQYRVEITNNTTNCTSAATAPVVSSTAPTSITAADVTTGYFADTASIVVTVDPVGDYEYRLDDGPWQTSNTFTGVSNVLGYAQTGSHTVYARDLKSCGQVEYAVYLVDYPKYFTPNGDGIHDTWNIPVLSGQPNAKIYIFDRSGKFLKQLYPTGTGWDGTFNGNPMPADDYWFVVKYEETGLNKEFRAHFTLKR
ncbi:MULTISPECIES: choice-of-anchor L domain-containing protein [unclassified Flavobacterium]|uniref:choice-of-anchor L domain-containing protein n=1 Tax=unclassified Flavobacterium TaxID=196869 RepID=UPI001F13C276|nr:MULTISPECIES: choice-of-anchor L domain-containing protein [unclassified Flavobacterium]UMY66726.1 choice-of-anchor L domain-containing protein [Flavobacterium sp. HJ-32-4]